MSLELELGTSCLQNRHSTLSHTSSPFCSGCYGDEVSRTLCLGWPRLAILLISASQVARITGMSHQHPAPLHFYLPPALSPASHTKACHPWVAMFSLYPSAQALHPSPPTSNNPEQVPPLPGSSPGYTAPLNGGWVPLLCIPIAPCAYLPCHTDHKTPKLPT
jgi:hypothetical protein